MISRLEVDSAVEKPEEVVEYESITVVVHYRVVRSPGLEFVAHADLSHSESYFSFACTL